MIIELIKLNLPKLNGGGGGRGAIPGNGGGGGGIGPLESPEFGGGGGGLGAIVIPKIKFLKQINCGKKSSDLL